MGAKEAKYNANYYINMGLLDLGVWGCLIYCLIQYAYITQLKKMGQNQKQLEEVFMGPEVVIAAVSVAPAIQYVVVPAS